MHVAVSLRSLAAAIAVALALSSAHVADAAANTAGAPEHLVAKGGECIRLFHSGGDIGCRTISKAEMAQLFPIESDSDLTAWLADSKDTSKRVLVLPEQLLTPKMIASAGSRLAGVYAFPDNVHNVSFAATSPQGTDSPDAKLNPFAAKNIAWNPQGVGLEGQSLSVPVVLLKDKDLGAKFLARAKMNVKSTSGATYRAFMNYYYGPETMNSVQCLQFKNVYGNRSPKCDPIGGQSAWGVRGDRTSNETVLVMTGMDAYALSQVLVPGANQGASGVVAMLAAVKALQAVPDSEFSKQIAFAAFQAEKFGFVGSRRFLKDITAAAKDKDAFCKAKVTGSKSPFGAEFCSSPLHPSLEFTSLTPTGIKYAIALDQVGFVDKKFAVHVNPNAATTDTTALVKTITSTPSSKSKFAKGTAGALPPTPLLSFVNGDEYGTSDLVSAVIAGYDTAYVGTGIYGSRHDVADNINVDAVALAAQVLAETVYTLAATKASSDVMAKISVDKDLIKTMITCVSSDWDCDLMRNYSTPFVNTMINHASLAGSSWPSFNKPASLYSGPMSWNRQPLVIKNVGTDKQSYLTDYTEAWSDDSNRVRLFPNVYEVFTRAFLAASLADASATTDKACKKTQDCDTGSECVYPGVCAKLRAHFHDAYSPGLTRTKSLQVYDIADKTMPLWTEPSWDSDVGSYVFPDPGEWIGWVSLAIGLVVSGVSFFLSKWVLAGVQKMKLL